MQSEIECIYKTFEGSGSIFVSKIPCPKAKELITKYQIRAIIALSRNFKIEQQYRSQIELLHFGIQQGENVDLVKYFKGSFQFINKNRESTNILICSAFGKSLPMIFSVAFLMKKYKYNLSYMNNLYDKIFKNTKIPERYQVLLERYSNGIQKVVEEEEEDPIQADTKIGRRIQRIRQQYPNLAKGCQYPFLSKKQQNPNNPQFIKLTKIQSTKEKKPVYEDDLQLDSAMKKRISENSINLGDYF